MLNRVFGPLLVAVGLVFPRVSGQTAEPVFINEFMANNATVLVDENGDNVDWIELRNISNVAVNLGGYYLTDSASNLRKWTIPSTNIAANGYLIIYASGKDRTSPRMHTDFSLDTDGEYLAFVKPDGVTKISEFNEFPEQYRDFSYGYDSTGTNLVYFSRGTPGAANSATATAFVADTKFSQKRGFYTTPFDVAITTGTAGATIRYTTNGIPPTATTGTIYAGPVRISGTTVLRAAAFKNGFQPSNVDTETYLFLADVIRQSPTGAPPPGWPASWGQNTVNYGMDPNVVDDPLYRDTIINDLKTIPTFSIVMNVDDLFNASTGIYANPGQDGRAWERQCSVEYIRPDGVEGFQINAGIRIRGGFSRSTSNPKHALRLFFREEYGDAKLKYPLFGDRGADEFNNLDLRTFQNYSWSFQGDSSGVFIRDIFSRDTQLAMGHNAERGDYCHLYINGIYWGIYDSVERTEASYGETYFGGNKDNFDVVKVEAGPYTINATDGNMNAWNALHNQAAAGLSSNAAYFKTQGLNADGTRNPAYSNLVDVVNLIDYMLVIIYGGNLDAPISNFLNNDRPNNWYGMRDRTGDWGFRFFAHDSEHTLLPGDAGRDRTGPFVAGQNGIVYSNPQYIWQQMSANAEFRLLVADRIHRYYFNNGILTPTTAADRFRARMAQIDRAVVGESARWGDSKREPAYTRATWVAACNSVLNNWFPNRSTTTLNQLKAKNLYPNVAAPSFNQFGGNVNAGFTLTMTAPAGTIYYTLDGSDPRLIGGAVSPAARTYSSGLALNNSVLAKARVLSGTTWSAVNEAPFNIIRTNRDLMITEIMYHPTGGTGTNDADDLEFIELKNTSNAEMDLSGIRFTNGVAYTFPLGKRLGAGEFAVLVRNPRAFTNAYPGVVWDGEYTNKLADGGETIALIHAAGAPITSVTYSDTVPWPISADGAGFSLVPRNPNLNPNPNDPLNWRASSALGGSPGRDDPPANVPQVVINEALTHTDLPAVDFVEIYNPTASDADISGWYLTDDRLTPKKYKFPNPTIIPSGQYLVVDENSFNPTPGVGTSFSLSSHGDEVFIYSADLNDNLTGYSDGFSFGGAANGVTFGRYTNSVGEVLFPPQLTVTSNAVNSGPRVGDIVINEIRYQPLPGDEEFVELHNRTGVAIKLYDVDRPTNRWKISGLDFDFPAGTEIAANGYLVVSSVDPTLFRSHNNVPAGVPVVGPFSGALQDGGELLELRRPDVPDENPDGSFTVPYIAIDEVRYNNRAPWPLGAAGAGPSLERIDASAFGNDPINWRASAGPASPGIDNNGNRPPQADAGADGALTAIQFPTSVNLAPTISDDGKPSAALTYSWTQVSGPGVVLFGNASAAATTAGLPGVGLYVLRLTVSDGELSSSDTVQFQVDRPLNGVTFVSTGSTWRYLDDGSNQGTDWRNESFDDSAWKAGAARLGYGNDGEVTLVNSGPSGSRFITTYFRRTFNVASVAGLRELTVRLLRDDGGVVYLNGTEIFRSNLPEGVTILFSTPAQDVVSDVNEHTFFEKLVSPTLLRAGQNTLAVEIHQQSGGSTDIGLDLEMVGQVSGENTAPIVNPGPDLTVTLPQEAILNGSVIDDGLPSPPGAPVNTWTKVSGPGTVVFANANSARTTAAFSEPGVYVLQLSSTDGEFGRQQQMTVHVNGNSAYDIWRSEHFNAAELSDPAISGDDADADGDSMTNLEEYLAGTDPRDGLSYLGLGSVFLQTGVALRFEAKPGRSYTVITRENAESGIWEQMRLIQPSPDPRIVEVPVDNPVDEPHRFFQVIIPTE